MLEHAEENFTTCLEYEGTYPVYPEERARAITELSSVRNKLSKLDDSNEKDKLYSSDYKKWSSENRLSLNELNILNLETNNDDLCFPNIGLMIKKPEGESLHPVYRMFNAVKQEYNTARYLLYQESSQRNDTHESQLDNYIINTLDYPVISFGVEQLKSVIKISYGVLDKIAIILNDYFETKNDHKNLNIFNWYLYKKDGEIIKIDEVKENIHLSALCSLTDDLNLKVGYSKTLKRIRNYLEHRIVSVYEFLDDNLEERLENTSLPEYKITYDELLDMSYDIIRKTRAAIFYLIYGMREIRDKFWEGEHYIPSGLSYYDDEWKRYMG